MSRDKQERKNPQRNEFRAYEAVNYEACEARQVHGTKGVDSTSECSQLRRGACIGCEKWKRTCEQTAWKRTKPCKYHTTAETPRIDKISNAGNVSRSPAVRGRKKEEDARLIKARVIRGHDSLREDCEIAACPNISRKYSLVSPWFINIEQLPLHTLVQGTVVRLNNGCLLDVIREESQRCEGTGL
ncbi:hypothetical protein K0M31_012672 [Melipona bicolor]|uniref:Uncharacterized protein n=1 Tax=Melipona bicolor TaxID=60889 RepID=A0AA40FIW4_9HYME|nr:hypothetical protein K0M31_012672 [Melipona bicolor]